MPQRGSAACLAHPTPGTRPGASACSCIIPCCICIKACITLGLVMACWKSGFCICLNANESQVFLISELVVIKGTHCLCLRHKEFWSGLENWNRNHDDLSYSLPTFSLHIFESWELFLLPMRFLEIHQHQWQCQRFLTQLSHGCWSFCETKNHLSLGGNVLEAWTFCKRNKIWLKISRQEYSPEDIIESFLSGGFIGVYLRDKISGTNDLIGKYFQCNWWT